LPTFCRHNRFLENCPICSKELEPAAASRPGRSRAASRSRSGGGSGVRIRQAARRADDGYRESLVPGVRVADDARRLATEISFAAARLEELAASPPGLYAEVASEPDLEEATWLAFLIAYLCPVEGTAPFAFIEAARTSWRTGELPVLEPPPSDGPVAGTGDPPEPDTGPRSAHSPARGAATLVAYRRWAERAGSQAAAFTGEGHWDGPRRFERVFERLALPGLHRAARFDLLVTLGRTGRYDLRAASLMMRGAPVADDASVAAKRVFGIADPMLIDRRAAALAEACQVPFEALDLALYNWQRGDDARATLGAGAAARDDASHAERAAAALGV
jgi:hypothetical protein